MTISTTDWLRGNHPKQKRPPTTRGAAIRLAKLVAAKKGLSADAQEIARYILEQNKPSE